MPVHSKIPICTFTFGYNPLLTQQDDIRGQYVCVLKISENLTPNMGDIAKSPFLQFFLSLSLFFSLNHSISKTIRGTGLKFCTQV